MKNLFEIAKNCLYLTDIDEKLKLTHQAKALMDSQSISIEHNCDILPIRDVQFPQKPLLLAPRLMPRRNLGSKDGVVAFFHAIAHVEFMAIYLAWDILYRFRNLNEQFYQDWLTIADEEAQHFQIIHQHLRAMGVEYGDLPAHGGLWDHAVATAGDLLGRLALVPRCMEARGLDVTPAIISKFSALGDKEGVVILERILTDEVKHVERGSYWFNFFCGQQGLDSEGYFKEMIGKYYIGGKPKGPFNREKRKIAGFSDAELDWLEAR